MKLLLPLLLLVLSSNSFCEERTSFEYTKEIHTKISELTNVQPSSYQVRVYELKSELEKFFSHKKKVCNGEFSSVILTDSLKEGVSNKLTKDEKELCFRELKALQTSFINNLFLARKNYLQWGHDKNLSDLNKEREKAILSLKKSFAKKGSRSRRR
jgi:hypothetical protein